MVYLLGGATLWGSDVSLLHFKNYEKENKKSEEEDNPCHEQRNCHRSKVNLTEFFGRDIL